MSELLPCPFCGNYKGDENNDAPHVCYSELRQAELAHCEACGAEVHAYGKDPRVTWNTRPIEDELRAEIYKRDEIIRQLKEEKRSLAGSVITHLALMKERETDRHDLPKD